MPIGPVQPRLRGKRRHATWIGTTVLLWPVLLFGPGGCVRDERIATPGDTSPPEVTLREPAAGDVVADTLRVRADVSDDQRVARVALLVDDVPRAIRHEPPWGFTWPCSAIADSAPHSVMLEASDAAGNFASTPPREVTVCPNRAPRVWIAFPWDDLWIEGGSQMALLPWRAQAIDPEDGPLTAAGLIWSINQSVLPVGGPEITPPPLPPGLSAVTLTVADRWGRKAAVTHEVQVFTYPSAATPREACEAFFLSWRARDAPAATSLCAADARLIPPGGPEPPAEWNHSRFTAALSAWLRDSTLIRFEVVTSTGRAEELIWGEDRWAKLEFTDLRIETENVRMRPPDRPPQTESVRIRTAVRVFLRLERETGAWRIATWWDLHASPWLSAEGPSLSAVLERALGAWPD